MSVCVIGLLNDASTLENIEGIRRVNRRGNGRVVDRGVR